MTDAEIELPGPAWKLSEIAVDFVVYKYATFRTNEELLIYHYADGSYSASMTGTEGRDVTARLPQAKWEALYVKAIAAQALLGRLPNIIEEIF